MLGKVKYIYKETYTESQLIAQRVEVTLNPEVGGFCVTMAKDPCFGRQQPKMDKTNPTTKTNDWRAWFKSSSEEWFSS